VKLRDSLWPRVGTGRWLALSVVCALVAGAAATAATARTEQHSKVIITPATAPLATALYDPIFAGPQATGAYSLARNAGATYARIIVAWKSIAPVKYPKHGFAQSDPNSPYYRWGALDASVSAAVAAGLTPILDIFTTPSWGYSVKPTFAGGTPKIPALAHFATAVATRYDGSGPEPAVHVFSVWNEPNFNRNLYPQNPMVYKEMVNAVADSVHGVNPANLAVAGELAPFKHQSSASDKNRVTPPLDFMRKMLCLSGGAHPHLTCNSQAKFDVWTHHPYSDTGPFGHARSGGVELGDLPAMDAVLQQAEQLGAISSAQPVQFWTTEIGWSSNPPNKHGVSITLETRWVAESFYQMFRSGVTLGTWFLVQDEPLSTPFQCGLYTYSSSLSKAKPKPLLTPFRFPFVAYLKAHGKVLVWGRDATSDTQDVTIQRQVRSKGAWKTVATIRSNAYGIFTATLPIGAKAADSLRAVAPGSGKATPFSLTVPKGENARVNPFPLNN
jgi:hypothetical protein